MPAYIYFFINVNHKIMITMMTKNRPICHRRDHLGSNCNMNKKYIVQDTTLFVIKI